MPPPHPTLCHRKCCRRHPIAAAAPSTVLLLPLLLLAMQIALPPVAGDILVYTYSVPQLLIEEFHDLPARFGPKLPDSGVQMYATAGFPIDGCDRMQPPPKLPDPTANATAAPFVVIVARGMCSFDQKVRNAQAAGFAAVIVHNVDSNGLEPMSAKDDTGIDIPSVFVGELTGIKLLTNYQYQNEYLVVLNADLPFDINTKLILPFSLIVVLCFCIMMGFMIMKCVREQRRLRRHRLPRSALKAIPVVRFNKSTMTYETCIICLDDYTDGEKLRVLPCDHAYHCKCIDIWLTKNRRVCPICKRKVLFRRHPNRTQQAAATAAAQASQRQQQQRHHRSSDDSMSDSDADDSTPLLNPVEHSAASANHGTFSGGAGGSQRVNPFDRSPNLPPNLRAELSEHTDDTATFPQRLRSLFQRMGRRTASTDNVTATVVAIPSNNIMNANLSGSFRDETVTVAANDSDDDQLLAATSIYEPTTSVSPAAQPSSSSQSARLGVVAIPNMEFSPSPPPEVDAKPPNDFIV